jgi:hypothetical protein
MPNPYEVYEGASEGLSMASSAAGAATGFSNPMGGVLNAQKAYHMHQYGKLVSQLGLLAHLLNSYLADFVVSLAAKERHGTSFSERGASDSAAARNGNAAGASFRHDLWSKWNH